MPIVIYGVVKCARTVGKGRFFCTACGKERAFRRRRFAWYGLVFVPLLRLKDTDEEFVECSVCEEEFPLAVSVPLFGNQDTTPGRETATLGILAGALVAGEIDTERVREELGLACRELAGVAPTDAEMASAIRRAIADGPAVADLARAFTGPGDRERVLEAARRVVAAEGPPGPEAMAYLDRLAASLRGPPPNPGEPPAGRTPPRGPSRPGGSAPGTDTGPVGRTRPAEPR